MRNAYYILVISTILTTSSCQKENDGISTTAPNKKIEINTSIANTSSLSSSVKSPQLNEDGSGNFANGDEITLHVLSESGEATIIKYGVGTTNLYWRDISLNPEDNNVDFSACFPHQALSDGKFTFDLETTPNKDLLWAQRKSIPAESEATVDLLFKHVMHRLVINFTTQSNIEIDQINTVCTAKSTCEVDLHTLSLDNSSSNYADFSASGPKAVFMIIPQKASDVSLFVTVGQMSKQFALSDLVTEHDNLGSGMQLTVNLTVKDGSIVLEGSSIDQWGDQGTIDGEIIL